MSNMVGWPDRQISTQREFHDQGTLLNLALSRHIRDILDHEIRVVNDAKRVALVFETSQVPVTSDQCA